MSIVFAVDVGGTFTDIVTLESETGRVCVAKAPTTPDDPTRGVLEAIEKVGLRLDEASVFLHGTTLGVNTVLERKGATTGLIATQGFRDDLEIARMTWPMYLLHWTRPEPLVPRFLRREVSERVAADGTVLEKLDEEGLKTSVAGLIDEGVDSVAICFLHGYAFPEHEKQAEEVIRTAFPELSCTTSHAVSQEYREYERTVTTVVDAKIKRVISSYLGNLDREVKARGFGGNFLVTRCDGGVMSAAEASDKSVRTLISGPASGVMGAATIGAWAGVRNVLAIDMGGTSFDCALIVDGDPVIKPVAHVADMPLLMPTIELATIGAGGGSIAWVEPGGILEIGPQSAGAVPGPMCYGRGGVEPTFTDAALVSGLIDPEYFLGGELVLDLDAAERGIREKIAERLSLSVEEAAAGMVALTEAKMAATVEQITIGKGHDPREFALLAYGGGGPLAASAIARSLEIPTTIVPPSAAMFSAWGMLTLDFVHDFSKTVISSLDEVDVRDALAAFHELEGRAEEALDREGVSKDAQRVLRVIDIRYRNQEHAISVPFKLASDKEGWQGIRAEFERLHAAAYGYTVADPLEVVAYRVRGVGEVEKPRRPEADHVGGDPDSALKGSRSVNHRASGGRLPFKIYERQLIGTGVLVVGPAIIEEPTATTIIAPGDTCVVDDANNLVVTHER